jgi:DNA polymerase-3 subunit beta
VAYEEITLRETENHSVALTCGAFNTSLFGLSPDGFPELAEYDEDSLVAVDGRLLADAINKTQSAVVPGDDTYNLSGVQLLKEIENSVTVMKLVSTDTQRMTLATVLADNLDRLPLDGGIIVPPKGIQELKKLAEDAPVVELGISKTHLVGVTEMARLSIRQLEGPFPDYRKVIPVENDLRAWFNRQELLDAVKRINILISGKYSTAKFDFTNDLLTISVANPELGKAEEAVGIDYSGPEIVTGFNPGFYLEILSTMASEKIQLAMRNSKVSYLVTGPEDPGFLAVIVSSSLNE